MIILKSLREIERMRVACSMAAEILSLLSEQVKPGVSTLELEHIANVETGKRNAKAAFKGYHKYPYALCCSPNSQVVHGMPTSVPLEIGDILSLDFGIFYDEFFGDAAITVAVGDISTQAASLVAVTEAALYLGIEKAVIGSRLSDVSHEIQQYVELGGYSVVRDFVGHGIGRNLHEEPQVPNFGVSGKGVRLKAGMVFAIEPMINEKAYDVKILDDGWTVVTVDGGLSAHFEHTIAITDKGPDILTRLR